jgi:gas vesicle protein
MAKGFVFGVAIGTVAGAVAAYLLMPERKSQLAEQARAAMETGKQVLDESIQEGKEAAAQRRRELEERLRRGRSGDASFTAEDRD